MLNFVLSRLKEPSSYAGLSGIALAFGISTEFYSVAATAVAGVAGLVAFILAEKAKPE
jgi:hypothetical protein